MSQGTQNSVFVITFNRFCLFVINWTRCITGPTRVSVFAFVFMSIWILQ